MVHIVEYLSYALLDLSEGVQIHAVHLPRYIYSTALSNDTSEIRHQYNKPGMYV